MIVDKRIGEIPLFQRRLQINVFNSIAAIGAIAGRVQQVLSHIASFGIALTNGVILGKGGITLPGSKWKIRIFAVLPFSDARIRILKYPVAT